MDASMDKGGLLSQSRRAVSPPSYQTTASFGQCQPRSPFRRLFSFEVFVASLAAIAVLLMGEKVTHQVVRTAEDSTFSRDLVHFQQAVAQCEAINIFPTRPEPQSRTSNPRWTPTNGQNQTIILRNAKLFDGESVLPDLVDITFSKGLVVSVTKSDNESAKLVDATEFDVHGRFVTPGLVDMHSHHLARVWPSTEATEDENEMNPATKAFTPMVRVLDTLKPYDGATKIILSGGITSSLLLPGSANLMGGEGIPVKNVLYSGEHGEPVVEDLLLERGIPQEQRHRYMKMAFGENPKQVWDYTRMGNSWHLREHLQKAKDLKEKQDDYCSAISSTRTQWDSSKAKFIRQKGKFPFDIGLESTAAMLRGRVIVQNHNYEPQDLEAMLRISEEFDFRVSGFHHAIEAWQVPEMLKERAENVTVATFAEFSLYKWESFAPSLYAGHVLAKHNVAVAYKSDHVTDFTNAKYLASQAAVGHSFLLPEEKALQSITSVPAKAIDLDYRVGYCRAGYDADLVIWDSHPLSLGATPLQVFVDGQAQLEQKKVKESLGTNFTDTKPSRERTEPQPRMRYEPENAIREKTCLEAQGSGDIIIRGIRRAFIKNYPNLAESIDDTSDKPLQLVIEGGRVTCLGSSDACAQSSNRVQAATKPVEISLQDGSVLPGLTAVTGSLGMREIAALDSTGDGESKDQKIGDPESVLFAKYGVWLDGKQFARARLGGVTRAISPPIADGSGMVHGVSVEFLTSGKRSLLDGGIVQGEVALHVALEDVTKKSEGTISNAVGHLRKMLQDGKGKNNATVYGKVAAGEMPMVVFCNNKYDLAQLVLIKKDFPETNIVVDGGREAPYVAKDLAAAGIPVILTADRGAPDSFRSKDAYVGPPLTRSVASYLTEAGVKYAVAIPDYPGMRAQWRLHGLGPEASWTAKNAGLGAQETVDLVTKNVEEILGLKQSKDLVIFEGNPLQYGATVVLSFHADDDTGKLEIATCFPREDEFQ